MNILFTLRVCLYLSNECFYTRTSKVQFLLCNNGCIASFGHTNRLRSRSGSLHVSEYGELTNSDKLPIVGHVPAQRLVEALAGNLLHVFDRKSLNRQVGKRLVIAELCCGKHIVV